MPRYHKQEDFEAGLRQITPFFDSLGYSLTRVEPYRENEGFYYAARFNRNHRTIELTHLYSLGPVIYSLGNARIEHTSYLKALGVSELAHYPSFEDDSVSGYVALLHDLQNLLPPFFTGHENEFISHATRYMEEQRQQLEHDTLDLSYRAVQEPRLKAQARKLFFQGRYAEVVRIGSQLKYPDFLTKAERQMFALARKREHQKP